MKGYDEYNTILLPPRKAGDHLPRELSEFFYEQEKTKEENEKKRVEAAARLFDEQLKNSQMEMRTSPHSELSQSGLEDEAFAEDPNRAPPETTEVTKGSTNIMRLPSGLMKRDYCGLFM